ncbi:MAG: sugar ABC transporter permease YjfF [Lachnospiraceae bacterium]|nr:sugar ABC transporter permease YjfF [Lachnospiraceae bacterium]
MFKKESKTGAVTNKKSGLSDTNALLVITLVIFVLMYTGAITILGGQFTKWQTFFNILNGNAYLIILACGMSIVMICGGIDISLGGLTGLVTVACAVYLDEKGGSILVSVGIAICIGLAFGIVQGFLVAYLDIQPFIVSLAGMFFARGLAHIIRSAPFNVASETFNSLKETRIYISFLGSVNKKGVFVPAYIEIGVIIAICVAALMFMMMKWTRLGRNFYAVGGNRHSALMLGINVKRTKFLSHIICSLLGGLGAYVYFLHIGSGSGSNASGAEMDAIASSIIGGVMLTGGVGNIMGTFFGVLSLATIKSIVSAAGFNDPWWTNITVAIMLCFFLVIQSVVMARKKKAAKK